LPTVFLFREGALRKEVWNMKNGRTGPNQVEAKHQDGEILRAEEKHRFVMDSINDAVYRINPNVFFTCLNDTALKLTGLTTKTYPACSYLDPVAPKDPGAVSERDFRGGLRDFDGPAFPVPDQGSHGKGLLDDPVTVFFAGAVFVVAASLVGHQEEPSVEELDLLDPDFSITCADPFPGNPFGIMEDFLLHR
jgi:hypothetical protein